MTAGTTTTLLLEPAAADIASMSSISDDSSIRNVFLENHVIGAFKSMHHAIQASLSRIYSTIQQPAPRTTEYHRHTACVVPNLNDRDRLKSTTNHRDTNGDGLTTQMEVVQPSTLARERRFRIKTIDSVNGFGISKCRNESDLMKDGSGDKDDIGHGPLMNSYTPGDLPPPRNDCQLGGTPSTSVPRIRRSFIFVCFGSTGKLRLIQLNSRDVGTDRLFFGALREELRANSMWLSLLPRTFRRATFNYVKFVVRNGDMSRVEIVQEPAYPSLDDKQEYHPYGRPAISAHRLERGYSRMSRLSDDSTTFVEGIPKKLDCGVITLQNRDVEVFGTLFREYVAWDRMALCAIPALLALIIVPSLLRHVIFVASIVLVVTLIASSLLEVWKLITHGISSHAADPPRDEEQGEEGGSIELRSNHVTRFWSRYRSRKRAPPDGEGEESDDEDGDNDQEDEPEGSSELAGLIQLCVYNDSGTLPELIQKPVEELHDDATFFDWLQNLQVRRRSLLTWTGLLKLFGLWRVVGIDYCKINVLSHWRCQIVQRASYPPHTASSIYQPTEYDPDSLMTPMSAQYPWLGSETFVEFYRTSGQPRKRTNTHEILKRLIRKVDGKLRYNGSPHVGYAVELKEGLDLFRLAVFRLALLLISAAAGIVYAALMRDVQGGGAVASCLALLAFGFVYLIESSASRRTSRDEIR